MYVVTVPKNWNLMIVKGNQLWKIIDYQLRNVENKLTVGTRQSPILNIPPATGRTRSSEISIKVAITFDADGQTKNYSEHFSDI